MFSKVPVALGRELSQEPDEGGMVFTGDTGNLREEAEEVKEGLRLPTLEAFLCLPFSAYPLITTLLLWPLLAWTYFPAFSHFYILEMDTG